METARSEVGRQVNGDVKENLKCFRWKNCGMMESYRRFR
jgi:hypothetical protein